MPAPSLDAPTAAPLEAATRTHRRTVAGPATVAALSLVLLAVMVAAIGLGAAAISPAETARYLWAALTGDAIDARELGRYQIVWQIRTPRVLLAAFVGAGLSVVGVAVQALVRNALADPFVLGVSSGASVGAVAVGVFGGLSALGVYAVSAGAFLGALAASLLVYLAAASSAGITPLRLVLTGVAMSFGFQALMAVLVYLVPDGEATGTILFWTMGGFGAASWGGLPPLVIAVTAGIWVLRAASRRLDVMSLGDETAGSLGVDPRRLRLGLFALTALMTGTMVALSGAIGFVGLVIPHLVRLLAGAAHARVLTVAPLVGAIFMVLVDLASRTLVAPRELPLGVITALIGVPLFVALMRRRAGR
ncbi:iron ABC transporter permease [Phytomonospora sp. NPDC050363]|uniref:FecCD family ABC transporter permease n=1 Tax=Phytomonospora sp. NPDC050363 TaxID=3155642 RepID=UPI0033CF7CA5